MRVAQVCPRFYPNIGGIETHVYEIAKRLTKYCEIEILTTDSSGKLPRLDSVGSLIIRRFKSIAPYNSYYFSFEMYKFLKKYSSNYNIVHAHNYHAFPALFTALTKGKNKLVFTPHYHGRGHSFFRDLLHKPYKLVGKKIFEKADAIICVSEFERDLILRNFDIDASKLFVIPNGINLDDFKDVDKIKRQKDNTNKIILYVGRIEKYKGLDYVVEALTLLPENFILEIVGDGCYRQKIVELTRDLKVADRVKFYKDLTRKELVERYAEADVLILLSKHEAYGLVVAEALASGTPCIVANTSALSEWVDGITVFGIDYPIDINKLAKLISKVVEIEIKKKVNVPDWKFVATRIREVYMQIG